MKNFIGNNFSIHGVLKVCAVIIFVMVVVWYILFQARHLIEGPIITLLEEPPVAQTERIVAIRGTAKNITSLSLNGRVIHTDDAGNFEERLVLENGYTIMTLTSYDRYGRSTSLSRPFVYTGL